MKGSLALREEEKGETISLLFPPVAARRCHPKDPPGRTICLRNIQRAVAFSSPRPRSESVGGKRAATWHRWDQMPREELHERLSRRLITGERVMLAHVYLKQGCVVPKHSHENEQFSYILEGALRFLVGEDGAEEIVVRAGEVLHLPSNLPHEAHALEDTLDVDVFSPPREDWLNKTDAYLRR